MKRDRVRIRGHVVVVLECVLTGEKRVHEFHNIVTDAGDEYYAQAACGESPAFTPAGIRLGTHAGAASAPVKGDTKMQTTTGSTPVGGTGDQPIDATYPKSDDDDADNTGAGADIVTWRASWGTGDANVANIATVDMPDTFTDASITKSLAIANFAAKFTKTSSDTLKVFVNHTMNGV